MTPASRAGPPGLATALLLLARGLWPVPIYPPDQPGVGSPGKAPIGKSWGKVRHTEESLRSIWKNHPRASAGIKLGKEAGVVDLEVDDPATGEGTMAELLGGECIETMGWSSARGKHLVFQYDDRLASCPAVIENDPRFPGVGLRFGSPDPEMGKQIQSVCPPSPTTTEVDGRVIAGEPRRWNGVEEIANLPEAFFGRLGAMHSGRAREGGQEATPYTPLTPKGPGPGPAGGTYGVNGVYGVGGAPRFCVRAGDRTERLRHYFDSALASEAAEVAASVEGSRNDRLNLASFRLGQFVPSGLPAEDARVALSEAARTAGLGEVETQRTIDSGMTAGMADPRDLSGVGATPYTPLTPKGPGPGPAGGTYGVNGVYGVGGYHPDDDEPIHARRWPAPPDEVAFQGLLGDLVRSIEPYTEADPIGLLFLFLVAIGNMIGRSAFFQVNGTRHHTNLFVATVGRTGSGRKGTALDIVKLLMRACDEEWTSTRIMSGLISGEGLIWEVRDPIRRRETVKEKGKVARYEEVEVDPGVTDKRLMIVEPEMGGTLKVLAREGNTLSAVIRNAWDSGEIRPLAKNNPGRATDAHISIIANITDVELNRQLSDVDASNGFANRFLWVSVRRSKLLPDGAAIPAPILQPLITRLQNVKASIDGPVRLDRDHDAGRLWHSAYPGLTNDRPGILGALLARAAPQVMRMACIYAILDLSRTIRRTHIEAALALWAYCERSAAYIFGDSLGDKDADHLLAAIRASPDGLSRTQIREDVFKKNKASWEIGAILVRLLELDLVRSEVIKTGGRDAERWRAIEHIQAPSPQPSSPEAEEDTWTA